MLAHSTLNYRSEDSTAIIVCLECLGCFSGCRPSLLAPFPFLGMFWVFFYLSSFNTGYVRVLTMHLPPSLSFPFFLDILFLEKHLLVLVGCVSKITFGVPEYRFIPSPISSHRKAKDLKLIRSFFLRVSNTNLTLSLSEP